MPLRPSLAEHKARTGILARLTIGAIGLVLLLAFAGPVILAAVSVLMMIVGVFGWLWRFSQSPISDEERQYALVCDQLEREQLRVDANRDAGFLPSDRGDGQRRERDHHLHVVDLAPSGRRRPNERTR